MQICIGALIFAETIGAAANLAIFTIQNGIKDCIDSIFSPELAEDLKKYYSQKAISYGMAAVFAGIGALKEIYTVGLKGFSLVQGKSTA